MQEEREEGGTHPRLGRLFQGEIKEGRGTTAKSDPIPGSEKEREGRRNKGMKRNYR